MNSWIFNTSLNAGRWYNINDSNYFIHKTKSLKKVSRNSTLKAEDVVCLNFNITHESDCSAIRETLDKREKKSIHN